MSNNSSLYPWQDQQSIYEHIQNNIDPETDGLLKSGFALPDEQKRFPEGELRWVAGGLDGAFGHHGGGDKEVDQAQIIFENVAQIAHDDLHEAKLTLYDELTADNLLDYIDTTLQKLVEDNVPPYPHLHAFVKMIVQEASDRGPIKFAIALLGLMGNEADLELVMHLGRHDEFTLYTAVAITNMVENPASALWELAKKVNGWGRIQVVERLKPPLSPEIKDWLLREGYKNNVMYEYLAYTCAVNGDLNIALANSAIDEPLIDGAGDILEALLMTGGPAEDINQYEDAGPSILAYIQHLFEFPRP